MIEALNEQIAPLDADACRRARDVWNSIAKPIGSLGVLEDDIVQIAGLTGSERVDLSKRIAVIMCADNGVVAEGVSQSGNDITVAVANSIARGTSSVCSMARPLGIESMAVNMGMVFEPSDPRVLDCCVARGTGNIARGPAMTRDQAFQAIASGIALAGQLADQGYRLIVSGEMGIANTTTSSAIAAVLLAMPVERITGRGAGLSNAGLERKIAAIKAALCVNNPDPSDPLDVLSKLGGFDIAGMVGLFIGGALYRVPVVVDGFISAISAYLATLIAPRSAVCMLASHTSDQPGVPQLMARLAQRCDQAGLGECGVRFSPAIQAGLRLGEGTGAVCLVPLLDAALGLYNGTTFEATGIAAYEVDLK